MTLYDMFSTSHYDQIFDVYVTNAYDENLPVGHGPGSRDYMMEHSMDGDPAIFDVLTNEVDNWWAKGDSVVVLLKSKDYEVPVKEMYDERYVAKWDIRNPEKRP